MQVRLAPRARVVEGRRQVRVEGLAERERREAGALEELGQRRGGEDGRGGLEPVRRVEGRVGERREHVVLAQAERRHQRIHAGHNCWVLPEEECFLTEELLRATCMIGTRDELLQRLRDLEAAEARERAVAEAAGSTTTRCATATRTWRSSCARRAGASGRVLGLH